MKALAQTLSTVLLLTLAATAQARLTPQQVAALPPAATEPVVFGRDIKPLLEASCIQCHARGRVKGGFALETRETLLKGGDSGPAVVAGNSAASLLTELIAGVDPDNVMPRKGKRLTAKQVGMVRAWIDQGLVWDEAVSFARPPARNLKPMPASVAVSAGRNPLDQILEPYFVEHRFTPPKPIRNEAFARRLYLDLIGLLPPPDAARSFANDKEPNARQLLVRRLLEDNEKSAQHWLSFWNDLLRNDYRGTGFIDGGRKQITQWLFTALSTNLPYDQFVAQLINPVPESEGFTKGIVWRGVVNASQTPAMQAAQNIAQVFMGVNLKCASCHDSFINDWKLSDSYALACVYADKPLEMFLCDKPTGQMATAAFIYPELGPIDSAAERPQRLKRLAEIMTSPQNGRLSRTIVNRLWARFFGRGLIEPVDDMDQPAWNADVLNWLAQDLVSNRYDLKHTIEVIVTSEAYQLPAVNLGENDPKTYVFHGPAVRRMSAEQFRDALGQLTGIWYPSAEFTNASPEVRACLVPADPLTTALGRPNREQVVTTRSQTATTLQALELTNGHTLSSLLDSAASRLVETPGSTRDLIDHLYEQGLSREPTQAEHELAAGLVGSPPQKEGVEDFLWAMTMLPEFQLIY